MKKFEGTIRECLDHLARLLPPRGLRSSNDARKPLAEFVGNSPETFRTWFYGGTLPLGLPLLRLRYLLEIIGYKVTEVPELTVPVQHLADMLVYQVYTVDEASKLLSFDKKDSVMRLLRGESSSSTPRLQIIEMSWKEKQPEVERRRSEWHARLENIRSMVAHSSGISGESSEPEDRQDSSTTLSAPAYETAREDRQERPALTPDAVHQGGDPGRPGKMARSLASMADVILDLADDVLNLDEAQFDAFCKEADRDLVASLAKRLIDVVHRR